MIDKQHGKIVIVCDCCDEMFEGDPNQEFTAVWAKARREGWHALRTGLSWQHTCADCTEEGIRMSYWAVAQTQTRREHIAEHHLQCAGYQVYLPRLRIRRDYRHHVSPLFPNYIFVFIETIWFPIMRTIGVNRLIRNGEEPARVADRVIDEIRDREHGGYVRLPKPPPVGRKGQSLRILRGPFENHIGTLHADMTDGDRQKVLLNLLGRQTVIEIPTADITLDVPAIAASNPRRRRFRR